MSDGISFDITANDNTAGGVNSAINNIGKLGNAGSVSSPDAIMNKWTKSQYAAALAGSNLTDKAIELSKAVDNGSMSIKQATKEYAAYEKQQKQAVWSTMTLGEKYQAIKPKIQAVGMELAKVGAAGAAVGYTTKKIYDFAKSGAQLEYTQTRFERLSKSMGTTGDVLMGQLRDATKGTVSDMKLAEQAANMFQLGLAGSSEEAIRLSKIQTALGMDTGELTLALANQSKRRLDQLGLSLTKFNEIEAKLKGKGMSKEAAFREAFMQTAEYTIGTTGNMADTNLGQFQRLEAGLANVWNQVKLAAPDMNMGWLFGGDTVAQTTGKVGMFMNGVASLMKGDTVIDWQKVMSGQDSWISAPTKQNPLLTPDALKKQYTGTTYTPGGGAPGSVTAKREGVSASQNAQDNYKRARGIITDTEKAAAAQTSEDTQQVTQDYMALTEQGMKLTKMSDDYSGSLGELNVKLQEQNDLMDKYSKYGDTSKKYQEAKANADAIKANITQVQNAQAQQTTQVAFGGLDKQNIDPKTYFDTASALGLMSTQSAKVATAQDLMNKQLEAGKISSTQYASMVKGLSSALASMDNQKITTYLDIIITKKGDVSGVGADVANRTGSRYGGEQLAGGGTNIAPGVYSVGEIGEEGLHIAKDGRVSVIPNNVWSAVKKYGIQPNGGFAMGTDIQGGDGGSGPAGYAYLARRRGRSITIVSPSQAFGGGRQGGEQVAQNVAVLQKNVSDLTAIIGAMQGVATPSYTELGEYTMRRFEKGMENAVRKATG